MSSSLIHRIALPTLLLAGFAPLAAGADTSITPQQRGEFARQFVLKWGPHAARTYRVPVGIWARRMVSSFVAADAQTLRAALHAPGFDDALAMLASPTTGAAGVPGDRTTARPARAASSSTKQFGLSDQNLTFTPVAPCRILDTRLAGGPIPANGTRSFRAAATVHTDTFTAQGGSASNCNLAGLGATAVVINLTVVTPNTAGYATVYPFQTSLPLAASVNYSAGSVVNNSVIVRIPSPQTSSDFTLYSFAQAHFVADIVGVFSPPSTTPLQCTTVDGTSVLIPANAVSAVNGPNCPSSYTRTATLCQGSPGFGYAGVSLVSSANGTCRWDNTTANAVRVVANSQCCRVPGR